VNSKVAEELRGEQRLEDAARTPLERLAPAQQVRDEAVAAFAQAHGRRAEEAARVFVRRHQWGRRPSDAAAGEECGCHCRDTHPASQSHIASASVQACRPVSGK